jgi:hypothetical protein
MSDEAPARHEVRSLEALVVEAGHEHPATRSLSQAELTRRLIRQMEADQQQSARLSQEMRWLTWATAALAFVQVALAFWDLWRR